MRVSCKDFSFWCFSCILMPVTLNLIYPYAMRECNDNWNLMKGNKINEVAFLCVCISIFIDFPSSRFQNHFTYKRSEIKPRNGYKLCEISFLSHWNADIATFLWFLRHFTDLRIFCFFFFNQTAHSPKIVVMSICKKKKFFFQCRKKFNWKRQLGVISELREINVNPLEFKVFLRLSEFLYQFAQTRNLIWRKLQISPDTTEYSGLACDE
jgi:hypothetical protein